MKTLKGKIILSIMFVNFCGPMSKQLRQKCWNDWKARLNDMGIPCKNVSVKLNNGQEENLNNSEMKNFVEPDIDRSEVLAAAFLVNTINDFEVFSDDHFRENRIIIEQNNSKNSVVVDPEGHFRAWLRYSYGEPAVTASVRTYDSLPKQELSSFYLDNLVWISEGENNYFIERATMYHIKFYDKDYETSLQTLQTFSQKMSIAEKINSKALCDVAERISGCTEVDAFKIQKIYNALVEKEQEYNIFSKEHERGVFFV